MSWQLFTALSVMSLSISVILQRILIHKDKIDPFAYAVLFQGIVGILLMGVALIAGFSLPNIQSVLIPAGISILFFGVGHIVYAKTLQTVEASAFSVLFATQAVWIMLLGIVLLGETMTIAQVIGTGLIFASVAILAKNIRAIFSENGTLLGLLTGLFFGIAVYAWSYTGRFTDALSWAAVSFVSTSLVVLLVRPKTITAIRPLLTSRLLSKFALLALLYGIGSITMLFAYKYGMFAIVSPLRQTSIIVTVLLALMLLPGERNHIPRKILAAAVCTAGVVLIIL